MLSSNRFGRFKVPVGIINDAPEVVRLILGQVVVIRAEHTLYDNSVEYHAVADHFAELSPGEEMPEYDVSYDDDTGTITWSRVEGA